MDSIDDKKTWYHITPKGFRCMNSILNSLPEDAKILVVDDIDCDGLLTAYTAIHSLNEKFKDIDIHVNDSHGFSGDIDYYSTIYDLIIIVDSSSSLVENYSSNIPVIVIDHHEYDRDLVCPDNVLLINSKDTPGLESVSAGMLCYLLMKEYTLENNITFDDRLFSVGATTIYSDVVPVDKYVKLCLERLIYEIKEDNIHPLLNNLNSYCNPLNKNVLSYSIIPNINYTRKLQDENTIKMIYKNIFPIVNSSIRANSSYVKSVLNYILEISPSKVNIFENFISLDITNELNSMDISRPLKNFKGLVANKLQTLYNKPAIVIYKEEKGKSNVLEISFRSNNFDSHSFIKEYNYEGGGHLQACGCRCDPDRIDELLNRYNDYLNRLDAKITSNNYEKICLEQLKDIDMYDIASDNEYRFSNNKPKKFSLKVKGSDIGIVDFKTKRFEVGGIPITYYSMDSSMLDLKEENEYKFEIYPSIDSHILGTYNIIAERIV